MPIVLTKSNYRKCDVHLVKVTRGPERHNLHDLTVDVALEGDFRAAHVDGDNSALLATDTMRNTVYALAKGDPVADIESFARNLVGHFLEAGPTVTRARVKIVERPWARLEREGRQHPHAFQRAAGGHRVAIVTGEDSTTHIEAGIDDLLVLRTTGSGFEGYVHDRYTTLPETSDRILATSITATWTYRGADVEFEAVWHDVRGVLLDAFSDHYSPSVQFTLHRMGKAVLEAHPEIDRIHLSLPNKHHLLYDLGRFGLENDNEIFHASSEPYGLIEGTVERVGDALSPSADRPGAEISA